jgi:tetratricopeptide (TPR) repeat protein
MESINKWKTRGNQFFKLNDFLKAINCWEEALAVIKTLEYEHA